MWKLISIIITIILFAIFFIQNMVKVPVRFVITEPVEIRLTYLLLTSFVVGYLLCLIQSVAKETKKTGKHNEVEEVEEEEEIFD